MIKIYTRIIFSGMLLFVNNLHSQIISINDAADMESKQSLEYLVRNVLISGDCAILGDFSEQVFGDEDDDFDSKSYGYFKRPAGSAFPFKEGIVLTTGNAFEAGNTPGGGGAYPSNNNSLPGDADLETALSLTNTFDATYIKFNFTPTSTEISFRYIMASEEYDGSTECNFADSFAFLLKEVGTTTYTNLAVLPDGTPVSVTNINNSGACAANPRYFDGYDLPYTNYGGQTVALTAFANVIPDQAYEIKLVVADQNDSVWDSAIFLEAGSFVLGADLGDPHLTGDNTAACGTSILLDANYPAPDYKWYYDDGTGFGSAIAGETSQTYNANLGNGTYKVEAIVSVGCVAGDTIEVEFAQQPTATLPTNIQKCDDDNDGSMIFNLTDVEAAILDGQSTTDFEVLYFRDIAYTDQVAGADITSFTSTGQTIYARVRNLNSTNCVADTSFDLEVYDSAFPSATVPLLAECDNTSVGSDADDLILFNLIDRTTDILNGQLATDFTLTYFTDAGYTNQIPENTIPIIGDDITSYQNDPSLNDVNGRQTIYVRMTNNLTSTFTQPCFTDTTFEIEVYELPTLLTTVVTLIQCNDDLTLVEAFNLRLKEDEISANSALETFTYYETFAEAAAGIAIVGDEITNPAAYENDALFLPLGFDTVWVRVENADGCHRVAQVDLDVNPSSAVMNGFVTREFSQCDDGVDTADVVSTFDFSSVTADIQALFAPLVIDVLYYETETEANQGLVADQLDATNYDNTSQDQLIWVQIVSDFGSDCLAKGQYVQLHVEALPTANAPTTVMKECDDDQDGIFPFDTSMITSEILNGQTLADITITYFNEDGTPITGVVNSALPNPFSTISQTIDIVLTNNVTNDPDGACTDATTLTFIVDELPINDVQPIPAECETDPEDSQLIATFDTSSLEISVNAQVGMDITYIDALGNPLQDMDGNPIVSPFPSSFTTETQTITVVVTNPINPTCPQSRIVDFIVNPRPVFDDLDDEIVCENILPHEISVTNPDASDYRYDWFNSLNVPIGIDDPTLILLDEGDIEDITITGVEYTVIVTNLITNCTRTKTVNLKKSSNAIVSGDDIITVEFDSPTNSIEIITTNLGSGDYVFALQHNTDSRSWQDEPIFTDLQGGVYTVLINDENGCGESIPLAVFLLDYPKFLTPNNDGYNDVWQLIGLNSSSFTISPIQIFDRYGKIVAIINPTQGQGWDGLYNSEVLPSSEYWFTLSLTNSLGETIIKKGHFSLIRR